jgi:hypothetical protein
MDHFQTDTADYADIVLPSILDHLDYGESFLENSLAFDQIPPAEHDTFGAVTSDNDPAASAEPTVSPEIQ